MGLFKKKKKSDLARSIYEQEYRKGQLEAARKAGRAAGKKKYEPKKGGFLGGIASDFQSTAQKFGPGLQSGLMEQVGDFDPFRPKKSTKKAAKKIRKKTKRKKRSTTSRKGKQIIIKL